MWCFAFDGFIFSQAERCVKLFLARKEDYFQILKALQIAVLMGKAEAVHRARIAIVMMVSLGEALICV